MDNWEVAAALERMAGLLALKGENSFKVRAYSQASRQVVRLPEPLAKIIEEGRLEEVPGIGRALSAKIKELVATGQSAYLARLEEELSPELLTLFSIPGVGHRTAGRLVREFDLKSLEQLKRAALRGDVAALPGMGKALQENVLQFFREQGGEAERFHRGVALPLALQMQDILVQQPFVHCSSPAGEVRRGTETAAVVVMAVSLKDRPPEALAGSLLNVPGVVSLEPVGGGFLLSTLVGMPVRVEICPTEEYSTRLCALTGAPAHWEQLQTYAAQAGFELTAGALLREGRRVIIHGEEGLYRSLGLPFIPPELREGRGELETAAAGKLPRLVEISQIRGDLHLHSEWSDGTASIEEIHAAAGKMGYEYIAVTDHSPSLQIAGGLSPERLALQVKQIKEIRRAGGCHIFTGSEVDILSDGSLDLSDEILGGLDLVIASVHSNFRQSREEMTARICRAMEHPAVQVIGHPTGRLIGSRGGYQVDVLRLIEKAAETGTALEINGSPQRLDLSEEYLDHARSKGVRLLINTDAHSTATMADMTYGVTAARRGGLEAESILNTLPLDQLRDALTIKHRRKG